MPKSKKKLGLDVRNVAANNETAELFIYGEIVDDAWYDTDVSPQQIADALAPLQNVKSIDMYINSPGGGVFAGMAIYNQLTRMDAHITAHIDGVAASIASVIAMAADEVKMPGNSLLMIHNPLLVLIGYYNADDLVRLAEDLEPVKDIIVNVYEARFNISKEEIEALMAAETWLTAEKALEYGIVSEVGELKAMETVANKDERIINGVKFDAAAYKNLPELKAQEKPVADEKSEANPTEGTTSEEDKRVDYAQYENSIALTETYLN